MIKIVKKDKFRSSPLVNTQEDMVRVTMDMKNRDWYRLITFLYDNDLYEDKQELIQARKEDA